MKNILKAVAFFAFVGFCFNNIRVVVSQNGKISSDVTLSNIESVNAYCESTTGTPDDGDCQTSSSGGTCVDSSWIHDCKQPTK